MGKITKVEWADHTFNCWRGCSKVSEACRNCYAEKQAKRNPSVLGIWGDSGTRVVASESAWKEPLKWDRAAKAAGERHRVFCASMADVFEDWDGRIQDHNGRHLWISDRGTRGWEFDDGSAGFAFEKRPATMQDIRQRLFDLIDATPNLDWLLLTKRPENIAAMMPPAVCTTCRGTGWWETGPYSGKCICQGARLYRHNVWLGTTVENQQTADDRIPHLLRVPAKVHFLSCEPLLGQVDLDCWPESGCSRCWLDDEPGIDWVIAGGESGPHARPSHPEWFRSLQRQCAAAGVPFFMKQMGGHPNKRDEQQDIPSDLFIREFPHA